MRFSLMLAAVLAAIPVQRSDAEDTSARILDEVNFAREHPRDYAQALESRLATLRLYAGGSGKHALAEAIAFLKRTRPLSPLVLSSGMSLAALDHVRDEGPRGAIGHRGSDRSAPWDRMTRHGKWIGRAGENIAYGYSEPEMVVAQLIIDTDTPGRGHRKNIFAREFKVAGVATGGHVKYGTMSVIDFATEFIENRDLLASTGKSGNRLRSASLFARD